ncbi:MAG TPA: acetate uptake transporter [Mycobacteriales bacterium]|nr:acetate uptake transporter [Mycobacteriales bacterium]
MAATTATSERPVPAPAPDVADPAPLGLAAFALTTFILSLANANVYPSAAAAAVYTAIAYGGGAQLLAGMWEFRRGNTFGATAFSSYGGFWIAVFFIVQVGKIAPGAPGTAALFGTFFLGWAIFTAYMTIASMRVSGAVLVVFVLLTVTFVLLCIGAFHGSASLTHAGGWVGVATAAAAWYASFAGVTNSTFNKTVVPTFPLAR